MVDHHVKGFHLAGIAAGIKPGRKKDLGLIFSKTPATVAGVFTQNQIQAAPVILNRQRIQSGVIQAIIVNSGNANCCTGEQGMQDAIAMAEMIADPLGLQPDKVLVASTGVIGVRLPLEKIEAAIPQLTAAANPDRFIDLAQAIMTTDTVPKVVTRQDKIDGRPFTVTGIAKGAGMIHPNMATLLAFICTDVGASANELQSILKTNVDQTLNRISIDGDTSTNDMALLLANGCSGAVLKTDRDRILFSEVLHEVLSNLAKQLVTDGEGATKLIQVVVKGAVSVETAHIVADTVAKSALVKTAIYGEDANWGRILAAVGRSGISVDPDRIKVFFDNLLVFVNGTGTKDAEGGQIDRIVKQPTYTITIDLGQGDSEVTVSTCDFSVDYVRINADYRT